MNKALRITNSVYLIESKTTKGKLLIKLRGGTTVGYFDGEKIIQTMKLTASQQNTLKAAAENRGWEVKYEKQ